MNLVDGLIQEMARVRDKVLPAYVEIGAPGLIAATLMRMDLDKAAKALAEGDAIECIRVYESLKGYSL
jgi:hypothetical protein